MNSPLHEGMNVFVSFLKRWTLLCALLFGVFFYLLFAEVPALRPFGTAVGPVLQGSLPYVIFLLLYVTFCKIDARDLRPRKWHFWLQAIRVAMSALLVWTICSCGDNSLRLVLEGVFICVICPTASAAPVITEKLGGSIASLTIYTIMANGVTAIIIPLFFPMVEKAADISFLTAFLMVLRRILLVLVVPLILALLTKRFLPRVAQRVKSWRDLGFYLWCFNLAVVSGLTMHNILLTPVAGWVLWMLLLLPLFVCLLQFTIGKAVGRHYGDSISAGQALGQKNTVVGIWLTVTYLNPLAAVAPGAYVLWQNLVNAWQLWYKQKHGKLPF